ncbi:MAG TPA: amidohydrolase, partial [Acidimicrobiales bacterium]
MPDDNAPYLIIAADSHAGLPTEQYREYLESKYHEAFDEFLAGRAEQIEAITRLGIRDEEYAKKWF